MTWHPVGIFDAALADSVREFVEHEEYIQDAPFNRYTDLSGITEVQINLERLSETASRRRGVLQPVQSAIFADKRHCLVIAQIYESLMEHAVAITVRVFRERELAAQWLGVPDAILCPPATRA
jgi:butyrate kinase